MARAASCTFGDQFLPGGQHLALHRILAAYRTFREDITTDNWRISQSLAIQPPPRDDGVRDWWRVARKEGTVYISLAPPETRLLPPDPPCRIGDLPDSDPDIDLKELLRDALGKARRLMPLSTRMEEVVAAAGKVLSGPDGSAKARFLAAARIAQENDRQKYQAALGDLHQNCLLGFEMPLADFARAEVLLQLQAMLGQWLVEDWFESSREYLAVFVQKVSASAGERDKLVGAAHSLATTEYDWAQRALSRSLNCSTLAAMTDLLYVAMTRFLSVSSLLGCLESVGLASRLELNPHVVEEHFVCAWAGLTSAISLFATRPAAYARQLWAETSERKLDLSQFVRKNHSSPLHPVVTRRFADVLAAHARSSCDDPAGIAAGAEELMRLRDGYLRMGADEDRHFELEWIEHALLDAYRRLGDEASASAWSVRIAGKMAVWMSQRGPDSDASPAKS